MRFLSLTGVLLSSFATVSFAELEMPANSHEFATKPEASVLPERVTRVRYIYSSYKGQSSGYDNTGSKTDAPVSVDIKGGAFVFEYGITDNLSLQVLQKFVNKQTITVSDSVIKTQTALLKSKICNALGVTDSATCEATLSSKPSDTIAAALTKATNIPFNTSTSINDTASAYVDAATHKSADFDGSLGLGDLEVGVLWNPVKTESFHFAVGTGIRMPMNKDLAQFGEKSITRNAPEMAFRYNVDYLPVPSLDLAWQNQSELGIASGKYKTGGVDGTYTRKGVRNLGFIIAKPSLSGLNETLEMVGPKFGLTYDYGNEEYAKKGDGETLSLGHRGYELRYYAGLGLNFFRFGLPLNFDAEYEKSFKGSNIAVATDKTQFQLKGYYKF
jgi:hypothetical protein